MSNETLLPCSACDGTGDQRGNPKFPPCEFCNGTGLRNRAAPPSPVPQEVEEALKAVDWVVSEQDQNIPVEHAETLAAYIRSLSSPAPVEGLPEGCPETALFSPSVGFFSATGDENNVPPDDTAHVEIHPVGTRARLAATALASLSTPDSGNPHA